MRDERKTKKQLIDELSWLRLRLSDHENPVNDSLGSQPGLRVSNESILAINKIADKLHSSLDFQTVAEQSIEAMMDYSRSPSVLIYSLQENPPCLKLLHCRGFKKKQLATLPLEGSITGVAVKRREVVTSEDISADEQVYPQAKNVLVSEKYKCVISVPILAQNRALGAMNLIFKQKPDISPYDRETLLSIGKTIGLAMSNARHVARIESEVSERKQAEEELRIYKDHLEDLAKKRTKELSRANKSLKQLISERRRAERALKQSEEKFSKSFRTCPDSIIISSLTDGRFIEVNDSFLNATGYQREEVMGRTTLDLNLWPDKKERENFIRLLKENSRVRDFETKFLRKSGEMGIALISSELMELDKEPCLLAVSKDITERKKAEEELRRYKNSLEGLVQERTLELSEANKHLNREIIERRKTEKNLRKRTRELDKRIREINCLYDISRHVEKYGMDLDEIFQGTVDLIPLALKHPDNICSRITFNGREFPTNNFRKTKQKYEMDIMAHGKTAGKLEIFGLDQVMIKKGIEFLEDEKRLLQTVSGRLGRIIERVQAEERVRKSEKDYRTLFENAGEAILIAQEGVWVYANAKGEELFGYTREELATRPLVEFLHEEDRAMVAERHKRRLRGEKFINVYPFRIIRKDGKIRWVEINVVLFSWNDKPATLCFLPDITDRMYAEESLKRYATELEQRNEEIKQFAYIVSHDLRAPLVNLKGFAAELQNSIKNISPILENVIEQLDKEQRNNLQISLKEDIPEALEFINSSVARMDNFINSVLKLSRLGRKELKPESTDMNDLVNNILKTIGHQIEKKGAKVQVDTLPPMEADRTSMEQIMGNLLTNAVNYLETDCPGNIVVTGSQNRFETTIKVQDNGRGIAKQDMDKVFAPFRRAGKPDMPGEGMGLAYVQTLVRRHGGNIWCDSELDRGTTFTFTIPRKRS